MIVKTMSIIANTNIFGGRMNTMHVYIHVCVVFAYFYPLSHNFNNIIDKL